jgi:hypothetical protein
MTVAEGEHVEAGDLALGEATTLEDTFLGASDAGLLVHRPNEDVECLGIGGPIGTKAQLTG